MNGPSPPIDPVFLITSEATTAPEVSRFTETPAVPTLVHETVFPDADSRNADRSMVDSNTSVNLPRIRHGLLP